MAGATNRAFKAAGIPKAAIKELRIHDDFGYGEKPAAKGRGTSK